MKNIRLSFNVLAAIVALTILQACANKAGGLMQCKTPTLDPQAATAPVRVTITTETQGAYLRYTLDGSIPTCGSSGHGTTIPGQTGTVWVPTPTVFGRTLNAIACKAGLSDSPIASGYYTASN
jgi:hypothetical protein